MGKLSLIVLTFPWFPSPSSHCLFLLVNSFVFHYKVSSNAYGLLTLIHTFKCGTKSQLKNSMDAYRMEKARNPFLWELSWLSVFGPEDSPLQICYFIQVETSSSCPWFIWLLVTARKIKDWKSYYWWSKDFLNPQLQKKNESCLLAVTKPTSLPIIQHSL